MDPRTFMFYCYLFLGLLFVIFNSFIGGWVYKLTLLFTDRLKISEFFLFKVNSKNIDSFFFLTRCFSAFFGFFLIAFVLYNLYI